jgi:rubrerythrin
MSQLPASAPEGVGEAFAHLNAVANPSVDDLKMMVFLEASGQMAYAELAQSADNADVRKLLEANGREELAHAHRVAKVIKLLTGEEFAVPAAAENRYAKPSGRKVDRAVLEMLVAAETNGRSLYDIWAENTANAEAAELLRQNGLEETKHGDRAQQALALIGS